LDYDSGLAVLGQGENQTLKTIEQCYWDSIHANLSCIVPWSKSSTIRQYENYLNLLLILLLT